MTALSTLGFKDQETITITPQVAVVGQDYQPRSAGANINKSISLGTSAANAAAGGADEVYSNIISIAASGTGTLDLTSFTDMVGQTAVSLARVKEICVRLLSAADDSVVGTAANGITIDGTAVNGFRGQSNSGWFNGALSKMDVPNGGKVVWGVGNAAGIAVDGTHKIISIINNDSMVTAKVQVTVVGGTT